MYFPMFKSLDMGNLRNHTNAEELPNFIKLYGSITLLQIDAGFINFQFIIVVIWIMLIVFYLVLGYLLGSRSFPSLILVGDCLRGQV